MAFTLEDNFLQACKNGNMMLLMLTIQQNVNINCRSGYGLRRAIRYNQKTVWKFLLSKSELEVNLQNSHGQTALHTAARFNIPDAASDLLQRPEVDTNIGSVLGSSPSMVAVKYASKETLQILASDARVNLNIVDKQMRKLKDVIGAAILSCGAEVSEDISSILDSVAQQRVARCRVAGTSAAELLDEGYLTMSPPGGVPVPTTL